MAGHMGSQLIAQDKNVCSLKVMKVMGWDGMGCSEANARSTLFPTVRSLGLAAQVPNLPKMPNDVCSQGDSLAI